MKDVKMQSFILHPSSLILFFKVGTMTAQAQAPANRFEPRQGPTVNLDCQLGTVRYSPCGRFLAAGAYDATVRRWEVTDAGFTAMPSLTGHRGWVQALAFHPDRRRLFTADSWGEVRSWTYAERQAPPVRTMAAAHDGWIRDLAISPDGRLLATCGRDQKVRLWSIEDGRKLHELTEHNDDVFSVAFHPDGRSLVSGDLHGNVKQWDVANGRKMREFACRPLFFNAANFEQNVGGVRRLVFDAQGRTLACAGSRARTGGNVQGHPTALLFDWASGQLRHTLVVGDGADGYMYDVAFHATGFLMGVTSGNPGTGKFFFIRPGEQTPFFLSTRMTNCQSLAVHPNGTRLVVAATNAGSNGNGRPLRNGVYAANMSPLHVWDLPAS